MKICAFAALLIVPSFASAQCASCHPKIAASYKQTGMGRAFSVAASIPTGSYYHTASDTHFAMLERDGKFFQRRYQIGFGGKETNVDEKSIDFVMGSGNHAKTFLHRTPSGALQQLPLGWYAEKGGYLAMNPGYDKPDQPNSRRKISYECMFCHNAYPPIPTPEFRAEPVFSAPLPEGIDCARCHGPGDRHEQAARSGASRDAVRAAIVNPSRLPGDRQMEVCMQCHLETTSFPFPHSIVKYDRHPFSYQPGERLGDFMLYFDHPEKDRFQIVSSAYRLRMSQCFLKGALQCTTCHDPHASTSAAQIDRACMKCHSGLTAEHLAQSGCASCHMPKRRTIDVVHAVMTDHYIQRKPPSDSLKEIAEPHEPEILYRGEVSPYYTPAGEPYLSLAQIIEGNNRERGIRRLATALRRGARPEFYVELGDASKDPSAYESALRLRPDFLPALIGLGTISSLERATTTAPQNALAWQRLGEEYSKLRRTREAIAALEKSISLDAEVPEAHFALALALTQQANDPPRAEAEFRETIRLRPDDSPSHMNLAILLFPQKRIDESAYHFERALRYRPDYALGHLNYGLMLQARGKSAAAEEHLRKAISIGDEKTRASALDALKK